jgi:ATP-dependent Clp protease ATP-binding subunit ClpB
VVLSNRQARFQAEKSKSDEIQSVKRKMDELKAKAEDAERRYDLATAAYIGRFSLSRSPPATIG